MTANRKVYASARVQLTIEFAIGGGVWGEDAAIEQVHRQANEMAFDILRRGLVVQGLTIDPGSAVKTLADIVGEPKVTAILVEKAPP